MINIEIRNVFEADFSFIYECINLLEGTALNINKQNNIFIANINNPNNIYLQLKKNFL